MSEWLVELLGEEIDLQYAYQAFQNSNPSVVRESGQYFLKANEFVTYNQAEAVRNRAKDIAKIMSNSLHLHYRDSQPIRTGHIIQIDDNGQRHSYVFAEGNIQLRGDIVSIEINGIAPKTGEHNAVNILRSANNDKDLADALAYFSQGDWINLYKSYEMVRDHIGSQDDLIKNGWVSKEVLSRFTLTAQSRDAIGDSARHAAKKFKAPNDPMSIHEARALIGGMLDQWVNSVSKAE